jgi:hypothetical protein
MIKTPDPITQIFEDELVSMPVPHILATGKNVFTFNLKISSKTVGLKTGDVVGFKDETFEVMNGYTVTAQNDYLKLNLRPKPAVEKS